MKIASVALIVGSLLINHAAAAQEGVRVEGNYALQQLTQCAAAFSAPPEDVLVPPADDPSTSQAVGFVTPGQYGLLQVNVGFIIFLPSSGSAGTFQGNVDGFGGGSLGINTGGLNMGSGSNAFSGSYSANLDKGTVSFGGNTYNASWGGIDSQNIIHTLYLAGQITDPASGNPNCVVAYTLTRLNQNGEFPFTRVPATHSLPVK